MVERDGDKQAENRNHLTSTSWCLYDTVGGDVQPGSLLGPITGLAFSRDGGLLFSCSGSCLSVFDVRSGTLLHTARVLPPGLAVYGLDIGHKSLGAVFGDRCVCVVSGVPNYAASLDASSSARQRGRRNNDNRDCNVERGDGRYAWFRSVARLPRLRDRVWDARLIHGETEFQREGGMDEGNGGDMKRLLVGGRRSGDAEQDLVAVALAHNTVEVWDWKAPRGPARVFSACGGDPCLVYHACLWGRSLGDLRVACGTAFNKVLVWSPGRGLSPKSGVLRLEGHEGVVFRVSWRDDGRRLASVSDDRTVRIWDVDWGCFCFPISNERAAARSPGGRLVATGWGHVSRVWDVAFTDVGIVTAGEDGTVILWRATEPCHSTFPTTDPDRDRLLLTPRATLRGHSGSHVWRLALHHGGTRTAEKYLYSGGCREGGSGRNSGGVVLLATGGNDGGCKLWDLVFEATRERRVGSLWGETGEIPFLHLDPVAAVAVTPSTAHEKVCNQGDVPPTDERQPLLGNPSSLLDLDPIWNPYDIRRAKRPTVTDSRRRTKPSVVREICICREGLRAATVLLSDGSVWWVSDLSFGPWEPVVMVPRRRTDSVQEGVEESSPPYAGFQGAKMAAAGRVRHKTGKADMETQGNRDRESLMASCKAGDSPSSDSGVSAVANLVRPRCHLSARNTSSSVIGGARRINGSRDNRPPRDFSSSSLPTATDAHRRDRRSPIHAIVVGHDDGWMSLLVPPGEDPPASTPPRTSTYRFPRQLAPQDVRAGFEEEEFVASAEAAVGKDVSRGGKSDSIGRSPCPWRVLASWKGHRCRVTSLWVVQNDDETSRASSVVENSSLRVGNPRGGTVEGLGVERSVPPFTAALNTSRLSTRKLPDAAGAMFDGALVSAGADGSVAWWEWPGVVERGGVFVAEDVSGRMPAPKLRMVFHAGSPSSAATITSVVIDDRRRVDHLSCRDHPRQQLPEDHRSLRMPGKSAGNRESRERNSSDSGGTPLPSRKPPALEEAQGPMLCPKKTGAVVFCGDTKGNIQCFLEDVTAVEMGDSMKRSLPRGDRGGGRRSSMNKGVSPCLTLKRQHGKDQVSRLALLGDCLFSAGHDGYVNQYIISYPPLYLPRPRSETASSHRLETRPTDDDGGSDASRDRGQPPIMLTLMTCYAAAPITAISDLWVGSGEGGGVGRDNDSSPFHLAVAGRSGASRISLWDLTEGRQLLELECGNRHLAQDLAVRWRPAERPHQSDPCNGCTSTGASSPPTETQSGSSNGSGSRFKISKGIAIHRPGGIPPPFHTFAVAARPEPVTVTSTFTAREGEIKREKAASFVSAPRASLVEGVTAAAVEEEECGGGGGVYGSGDTDGGIVEERGVLIRFHSTVAEENEDVVDWQKKPSVDAALGGSGGERSQYQQQQYPRRRRVEPYEEGAGASIDRQITDRKTDTECILGHDKTPTEPRYDLPIAERSSAEAVKNHGSTPYVEASSTETAALPQGSSMDGAQNSWGFDGDRRDVWRGWGRKGRIERRPTVPPRHFSYSLVAPFHSQRVTCVKFLAPRSGAREERHDGDDELPGLRLVTGGEDGVVRILDTSDWLPGRSTGNVTVENSDGDALGVVPSGSPYSRPLVSPKSCRPNDAGSDSINAEPSSRTQTKLQPPVATAAVVQVLPSHESSVGAVTAVETPEGVYGEPGGDFLIVSGGGKMELRTWWLGGRVGKSSDGEEVGKGSRNASDTVPQAHWLVTTTPAPTSPLHAHRIMCLCVLPPLPGCSSTGSSPSEATCLVIAGDSGGGVAIFEIRRSRNPSIATTTASLSSSSEHAASRPIGRWLVTGERPVLCAAHIRVVLVEGGQRLELAKSSSEVEGASFGRKGTRSSRMSSGFVAVGGSGLIDELPYPESGSKDVGGEGKEVVCESPSVSARADMRSLPTAESDLGHDRRSEVVSREKEAVIDFIVTGDTSGTVTVWQLLRDGGDEKGSPGEDRPSQEDGVPGRFVHRGPEGRRRGNPRFDEASMPPVRLVPVLRYCAHQMGVLSVAIHALEDGPRFLIVTGGDDQALCVAEVDASSTSKTTMAGQSAVSLVAGGEPLRMEGAAGSAIKGVAVLPAARRGCGAAISVFAVARDQRLSRWDLVEECLQPQQQRRGGGGKTPGIMGREQETSIRTSLGIPVERDSCSSGGGENDRFTDSFSVESAAARSEEIDRAEVEDRRRWRFSWRAGCITDVCDVSGLDVVALPPLGPPSPMVFREKEGSQKEEARGDQDHFSEELTAFSAALVAVSGQGLQLIRFGGTGVIQSHVSKW